MSEETLLSVRLMTYNHSKYISQCLEGIEMQQTSFPFEVVIGDDFSTDNNIEIIKKFIANSPNRYVKCRLLDRKKGDTYDINRKKLGRLYNFSNIIENCNGKYIALLDGDDYWTDPLKLQKQVDFLEANKEINLCFTRANVLQDDKLTLHQIPQAEGDFYIYDDLLKHYNFIATASVVFRNIKLNIPNWFTKSPFGDLVIYFLVSQNKKIKCIPKVTTVYRIHKSGVWSGLEKVESIKKQLRFYRVIYNALNKKQKRIVREKSKLMFRNINYFANKKDIWSKIKARLNPYIYFN